jgi:hypothetical protein
MRLYHHYVVPWLVELAMRQRVLLPVRQRVVGTAAGPVLEIGAGSGLNLALYGPLARSVDHAAPLVRSASVSVARIIFRAAFQAQRLLR